jgi:isopenicillin N synthase-like dioxygenase
MDESPLEEPKARACGLLPIIDLTAARGDDRDAKRALAARIDAAFSTVGFCYVTRHGVPDRVVDHAFRVAEAFFRSPAELKNTVTVNASFMGYTGPELRNQFHVNYSSDGTISRDGDYNATSKESYVTAYDSADHGPGSSRESRNIWPEFMPEFRLGLCSYFDAFRRVGDSIMDMLAIALGLDDEFFRGKFADPMSLCIANYYPPLSREHVRAGMVSLPAHCDFSCITMVVQDDVGGLEVLERDTQRWVAAPPIPGSLVLNVGDMLARWSNNRYVSTPHRVMNLANGRARLSLPVTHNPNASVVVDPRDLGVSNESCLYPPIATGEYQRVRFEEIYAPRAGQQ